MADCLQGGHGTAEDPVRAAELYRAAAEQDYLPAVCDLGLCYENGTGVEQDPVRAAELYLQAAEGAILRRSATWRCAT